MARRWRVRRPWCIDQVANGPDKNLDLTPVSAAPAAAVRLSWDALVPRQSVPLIGERVDDDCQPCCDE